MVVWRAIHPKKGITQWDRNLTGPRTLKSQLPALVQIFILFGLCFFSTHRTKILD